MFGNRQDGRWGDTPLRVTGLLLLLIGATAMYLLFRKAPIALQPHPLVIDYVLAACGFSGLSLGTALTWLGRHIYDEVPTSARWARVAVETAPCGVDLRTFADVAALRLQTGAVTGFSGALPAEGATVARDDLRNEAAIGRIDA